MTEDEEKAEKDDEDTPIRRSRRTDRKSDQREELVNKVSASVICAKVLRPRARMRGREEFS